jgi:hypothetical protein
MPGLPRVGPSVPQQTDGLSRTGPSGLRQMRVLPRNGLNGLRQMRVLPRIGPSAPRLTDGRGRIGLDSVSRAKAVLPRIGPSAPRQTDGPAVTIGLKLPRGQVRTVVLRHGTIGLHALPQAPIQIDAVLPIAAQHQRADGAGTLWINSWPSLR